MRKKIYFFLILVCILWNNSLFLWAGTAEDRVRIARIEDAVNLCTTTDPSMVQGTLHDLIVTVNQSVYNPGDVMQIAVSIATAQNGVPGMVDLYVAYAYNESPLYFLSPGGISADTPAPLKTAWSIPAQTSENCLAFMVPKLYEDAQIRIYALLVSSGQDPGFADAWASNITWIDLELVAFPQMNLTDLKDETYLFEATQPGSQDIWVLPLRRWDLIFLGGLQDDPDTPEMESWANSLIPGLFSHVLVYMGRDALGRPWGVEMTTSFSEDGAAFRFVRLPEYGPFPAAVNRLDLAMGPKAVNQYRNRWAMRLSATALAAVKNTEDQLFKQIQEDWNTGFAYQLEFSWSGLLWDKDIFLVDDGRIGGASCTDYWLTLFETFSGVCIKGSRMSAQEMADYFKNDPNGSTAAVPKQFNPFGFEVTVKQLLALGYYPIDPPAHVFNCDGEQETGVPIPSRLISSPQLETISFIAIKKKF